MDLHQTLVNAINNRQNLSFSYEGHPRIVEPHAYGITQAGNKALRVYQTAGSSRKGLLPDWKIMLVSKITNLSASSETFASARPGYKTGDKGMRHIYAQI